MPLLDISLVGEFNLDLLLYGLPVDLPPERELLANNMALLLGGSPAITAHNLSALGSQVGFLTPAADDLFAELCLRELAAARVDVRRVSSPGIGTGVSVLLDHEGIRRTLTYLGAGTTLRYCDLDLDYLRSARHFHLSSPFLQTALLDDVPRLFFELKKAGLTISLDTNDDPYNNWAGPIREAMQYVDILMPNEREACALAGVPDIREAMKTLLKYVPLLVVKRGLGGAIACRAGEEEAVSAAPVRSIDAVGAGDSFNAGFLHGLVHDWPLRRCLEFGNLAGALSTTAIGGTAAFRDADAMKAFFEQHAAETPA